MLIPEQFLVFFYHVQFFHNIIKFTSQYSSLRALYANRELIYWEGIFAVQACRPLGWHNCSCCVSLSDLGSAVDLRFSVLP
jgi:hypothetical protein